MKKEQADSIIALMPAYLGACDNRTHECVETLRIPLMNVCGLTVDVARSVLATRALSAGYDVLIWIDADIVWTPEQLARLISLSREHAVASGVYCRRGLPDLLALPVSEINALRSGRAMKAGCHGFTAIRAEVYEAIDMEAVNAASDEPFVPYYLPAVVNGRYFPEDIAFWHRVREAGFNIHVDADILVGHAWRDKVWYAK